MRREAREHDPERTSGWHPSNEGMDGPSRLVSGIARPNPPPLGQQDGPSFDGGCGQPPSRRERTPVAGAALLTPRLVSSVACVSREP